MGSLLIHMNLKHHKLGDRVLNSCLVLDEDSRTFGDNYVILFYTCN